MVIPASRAGQGSPLNKAVQTSTSMPLYTLKSSDPNCSPECTVGTGRITQGPYTICGYRDVMWAASLKHSTCPVRVAEVTTLAGVKIENRGTDILPCAMKLYVHRVMSLETFMKERTWVELCEIIAINYPTCAQRPDAAEWRLRMLAMRGPEEYKRALPRIRADPIVQWCLVKAHVDGIGALEPVDRTLELRLEAVRTDPMAIRQLEPHERTEDVCLAAVEHGLSPNVLTVEEREPLRVRIAAVRKCPDNVRCLPPCERTERELRLELVRTNGNAIRHLTHAERAELELRLEAVQQDGTAIRHLRPEERTEPVLRLAAVRQNPEAFRHLDLEERKDPTLRLVAMCQSTAIVQSLMSEERVVQVTLTAMVNNMNRVYFKVQSVEGLTWILAPMPMK